LIPSIYLSAVALTSVSVIPTNIESLGKNDNCFKGILEGATYAVLPKSNNPLKNLKLSAAIPAPLIAPTAPTGSLPLKFVFSLKVFSVVFPDPPLDGFSENPPPNP